MGKVKLENWMVDTLRAEFATTSNKELADLFGVTTVTVSMWGSRLGLSKDPGWLYQQRLKNLKYARFFQHPFEHRKGYKQTKTWKRNPPCRAVINLDTLVTYPSVKAAAAVVSKQGPSIGQACRKGWRCGGYRWQYLDVYERQQAAAARCWNDWRKDGTPAWQRSSPRKKSEL